MKPRVSDVITAVTAVFDVSYNLLMSELRIRRFARPRQVAMFLAREMCGLSYPQIAEEFDRDHTTIIWANRRVASLIEAGEIDAESLEACRELIGRFTDMRSENLTSALGKPLVMQAAE